MNAITKSLIALLVTASAALAQDPSQTPPSTGAVPPTTSTTGTAQAPNPENFTAIHIVVQQNGGRPLEGANVKVTRPRGTEEMTTDDKGRIHFRVRREAEFEVEVSADGFDPIKFKRKLGKEADWATARVELFKKQLGTSYVGEFRVGRSADRENPERDFAKFVFDVRYYKDKSPIAGAAIVLHRADGRVVRRTTTDDQGDAEILIREGTTFTVKVKADGYADYTTRLSPGQLATSRRVAIQLRKN